MSILKIVFVAFLLMLSKAKVEAQDEPSAASVLSEKLDNAINLTREIKNECKPGLMVAIFHIKNGKVLGTPECSDNVPVELIEKFFELKDLLEKTEWNRIYRKTGKEFKLLLPVYYYSPEGCDKETVSHAEFNENMSAIFSLTEKLTEPVVILPVVQKKYFERNH